MKQKIFIFSILLLSNCQIIKTINASFDQMTEIKTEIPQHFELNNNMILVNVAINKITHKMYFDTRAPNVLFLKSGSWTDTLSVVSTPNLFQPKVANGQRIKRKFVKISKAECKLFSITDWVIPGIENNWDCNNNVGIIGHDEFSIGNKTKRKILKLNFDKQELTFINNIPANWTKIKSKFRLGYIKIFLTINDIEYSFGLDTGFGRAIILSKKNTDKNITSLTTKYKIYGKLFQVAGGAIVSDTIETKIAKEIFIKDSLKVRNAEIVLAPKNMPNLVGIEFMKNYNWIFDYKSKEVYISPRKNTISEANSFFRDFLGAAFDISTEPITVSTIVANSKAENSGIKLNDKILFINQINISDIPKCERKDKIQKILTNANEIVFTIKRNGKTKKILIE